MMRSVRRSSPVRSASCGLAALLAMGFGQSGAAGAAEPVPVTVGDKGCDPSVVAVLPGKTVFKIKNASHRAIEWEILKGVTVVEERENILPGFVVSVTAALDPGDYVMICGLLSNPKGSVKVAAADALPGPPAAGDLVGPLSDYKAYALNEADELLVETRRFVAALKAGKVDEAKALYAPTRQHYERIEPIAELFNDLDAAMDAREDDFERKSEDPAFTGFHRIEKGIFGDGSAKDLAPTADRLLADTVELRRRVADLAIAPKVMVGGAASLLEEVASKKISGEEDRYSRTDLWDFQANVDGARKIVALLDPIVAPRDPDFGPRVRANLAKVDGVLAKYRAESGGFVGYDRLSAEDRNRLKGPVTALAEDLSTLRGTLGLD